jgi:hypothetical protein
MAEAKPADPARVVPLGTARPQSTRNAAPDGVSFRAFGIAVALLVLAVAGLLVQTQRVSGQAAQITALSGQIDGLEAQLSAATAQLAGYDRQMGLIRANVSSVVDQVATLNALVQTDPAAPAPPGAPAASSPAPDAH